MAHKKGQGSTRNGRDSNPQYRGVKRGDGQAVSAGSILVRQLGTVFQALGAIRLPLRPLGHTRLPLQLV